MSDKNKKSEPELAYYMEDNVYEKVDRMGLVPFVSLIIYLDEVLHEYVLEDLSLPQTRYLFQLIQDCLNSKLNLAGLRADKSSYQKFVKTFKAFTDSLQYLPYIPIQPGLFIPATLANISFEVTEIVNEPPIPAVNTINEVLSKSSVPYASDDLYKRLSTKDAKVLYSNIFRWLFEFELLKELLNHLRTPNIEA